MPTLFHPFVIFSTHTPLDSLFFLFLLFFSSFLQFVIFSTHTHTGCICMTSLHCVFSYEIFSAHTPGFSVFSFLALNRFIIFSTHTGSSFSPLCIFYVYIFCPPHTLLLFLASIPPPDELSAFPLLCHLWHKLRFPKPRTYLSWKNELSKISKMTTPPPLNLFKI